MWSIIITIVSHFHYFVIVWKLLLSFWTPIKPWELSGARLSQKRTTRMNFIQNTLGDQIYQIHRLWLIRMTLTKLFPVIYSPPRLALYSNRPTTSKQVVDIIVMYNKYDILLFTFISISSWYYCHINFC